MKNIDNNKNKTKDDKKNKTKEDKKNIDYKAIIIWAVFGIVFILFLIFLYKNFFSTSFSN